MLIICQELAVGLIHSFQGELQLVVLFLKLLVVVLQVRNTGYQVRGLPVPVTKPGKIEKGDLIYFRLLKHPNAQIRGERRAHRGLVMLQCPVICSAQRSWSNFRSVLQF